MRYALNNFFSSVTLFGTIPFFMLVIILFVRFNQSLALQLLVAMFVTEGICALIKIIWPTRRPIPRPAQKLFEKYDAGSFPSIHSARIVALATLTNIQYADVLLLSVSTILALSVGYSRIYLGYHRYWDVFAGFCIGVIIAILTWVASYGIA